MPVNQIRDSRTLAPERSSRQDVVPDTNTDTDPAGGGENKTIVGHDTITADATVSMNAAVATPTRPPPPPPPPPLPPALDEWTRTRTEEDHEERIKDHDDDHEHHDHDADADAEGSATSTLWPTSIAPSASSSSSSSSSMSTSSPNVPRAKGGYAPDSLEYFLEEQGVPPHRVRECVTRLVAWRVTKGGRLLMDRRRRNRVERNMRLIVDYLVEECEVERGSQGVGRVLATSPMILLCKPTLNDRWDRRAIELLVRGFTCRCTILI